MTSIPSSASFYFEGATYITSGVCEYTGPDFEFEGITNLSIVDLDARARVVAPSDLLVRVAESALDYEARDQLRAARDWLRTL